MSSTSQASAARRESPLAGALPASLPAFYHVVVHAESPHLSALLALDHLQQLVPVYRVGRALPLHAEAEQAAHTVRHILDRLSRLRAAYGEWRAFDAPAYFDLSHEQCQLLLQITERVSNVHLNFLPDLLLPSFQGLVNLWANTGPPPSVDGGNSHEAHERYVQQSLPLLVEGWQHASAVVMETRRLLAGDIDYLAANGAEEERWRWRSEPLALQQFTHTQQMLMASMSMAHIPTLALTMDLPLPAWRQAGRTRRLWRNRAHAKHNRRRR